MAIKVNVPGVGDIEIQGAAEEATMQKILAALSKTAKGSADNAKKTDEAQKKFIKNTKDAEEALTGFAQAEREAEAETRRFKDSQRAAGAEFAKGLGNFAKNLTLSAANLTLGFAKAHESIASDPIGAGAAIINTGIDLVAQGSKVVSKGLGSIAEGIPIIGGIVKGASEAAQAAIDLAAAAAKMANDFLSAELKKTAGALKDLSAQGASFAGGMTEMRNTANGAGMNLVMFTNVMKSSKDSITLMGLSSTEAAQVLGTNLKSLATTTGKSGMSLRNEMLAMGYSYEEQGAIMSQYMAGLQTSGKLEKMSREEIAKGTKDYARDLKVLADLTGKDAKKAMEEAQKKSLEADILAKLSPEEAEKFQKAYASMPDYAKKGFLQYVSSGGTAIADASTNIMMSQNAEFEKLVKGSYDSIKDSSKNASDIQQQVLVGASRVSKEQEKLAKEGGAAINQAATMGIGGVVGETATMANAMIAAGRYQEEAVTASGVAATAQSEATDGATKGFVQATEAATNFSIKVEELATQALPKYSELLAKAMQSMVDMLRKAGVNIAETAEEAAARKKAESEADAAEAVRNAELERLASGGSINRALTNDMGMDFGQLSGSGGGIFEGPESGFPVLLHGTEAVIPMDQLTGAKKTGSVSAGDPASIEDKKQKEPVSLSNAGISFGGFNEYLGYNMGPMSTNVSTISKIAEQIGAFDKTSQTITDPDTWKKILNTGVGVEYDLGMAKFGGAASFGPEFGEMMGKAIKEAISGPSGMTLDQALKEAMSAYQQAFLENSQKMLQVLEEGNDISGRLLNASY
jgi:hypothetical protein